MSNEGERAESRRARKAAENSLLLKLGENKPLGIAVTAAAMIALAFAVNIAGVPNPNMILVAGLVVCASVFGLAGGLTAAIVMLAYTLCFFSTGHDFVSFTDENTQKVVVSLIGVTIITLFVTFLRQTVTRSLEDLERLNGELEEDNHLLETATAVDSLTGVRNRFGLRRDSPDFLGMSLNVMMVDLDDFKEINDSGGHHAGDDVLNQMGRLLSDICGKNHVYRYGGDEVLVIQPRTDQDAFERDLALIEERASAITVESLDGPIHFSAGYTYGEPHIQSDLRLMIRQADANLYEAKNAGKGDVIGCAFSKEKASTLDSSHPANR